jgi:hypothetical protein
MHIEIQGSLVKVHGSPPGQKNEEQPRRGNVTSFSQKSRKRLLEIIARLNDVKQALFVTLTYGQKFPSEAAANKDLKAFIRKLRFIWPRIGVIWRRELQQRGAPHFHLIIFNVKYIPKNWVAVTWAETITYEHLDFSQGEPLPPFTRIEAIDNKKKAMLYVSKYVAKVADVDTGLNDVPYQNTPSSGRHWGITGKCWMMWAVLVELPLGSINQFKNLMLVAQLTYKKLRRWRKLAGFTIFCENAYDWLSDTRTAMECFAYDSDFAFSNEDCLAYMGAKDACKWKLAF